MSSQIDDSSFQSIVPLIQRGRKYILVNHYIVVSSNLCFGILATLLDFKSWAVLLAITPGIIIISFFTFLLFRGLSWTRWIIVTYVSILGFLFIVGSVVFTFVVDKTAIYIITLIVTMLMGIQHLLYAFILYFSESVEAFVHLRKPVLKENWESLTPEQSTLDQRDYKDDSEVITEANRRAAFLNIAKRLFLTIYALIFILFLLGSALAINQIFNHVRQEKNELSEAQSFNFNELTHGYDLGFLSLGFYFGTRAVGALVLFQLMLLMAVGIPGSIILGYIGFFVLPFLLLIPLIMPFSVRWKAPGRFLLLRPFNRSYVSDELKKIAKMEIANFGHIYTLSDAEIKVPWYVRIPLFLGQISFFNFRFRTLYRPSQLLKLSIAMEHRVRRNLNWCLSFSKIFSVRCTDAGWRTVITFLAPKFDGYIFDLSHASINVLWEMRFLKSIDALKRTIFLVHRERLKYAQDLFSKELIGSDEEEKYTFIIYDENGLVDTEKFRSSLASMILHATG